MAAGVRPANPTTSLLSRVAVLALPARPRGPLWAFAPAVTLTAIPSSAALTTFFVLQNEDGSWTEDYTTGTGFPCVFYLKYDMYRQHFPLLALATYKKMS